tara:strand:+ start:735 stop:947 length:213 start_codon:yes stop_codon:yes gene_type:complete
MNKPTIKKIITEKVLPFPFPNKEPTNIKKNIALEDIILKFIPITDPIMKKKNINNILPIPIPKCDPTNAI